MTFIVKYKAVVLTRCMKRQIWQKGLAKCLYTWKYL